jgi:hypothetical protein
LLSRLRIESIRVLFNIADLRHYLAGIAYAKPGDNDKAAADTQKAVHLDPKLLQLIKRKWPESGSYITLIVRLSHSCTSACRVVTYHFPDWAEI